METTEQVVTMSRIEDKAPEFKAITTQGEINFPSDYEGKWVMGYDCHECHILHNISSGQKSSNIIS
jgi:hypothetical protein